MITKFLGGGIFVLVVLLGFTYWQKESAETRADQLEQRNATLSETAEHNASEAAGLRAQMEEQGRRLAALQQARERLRRELQVTQTDLNDAMEAGDEQVQECRGVSVPDAVIDQLRKHAGPDNSD